MTGEITNESLGEMDTSAEYASQNMKIDEMSDEAGESARTAESDIGSNHRSADCKEVVRKMVDNFQKMGCHMSLKLHFFDSHIDYFPANVGAYSEGEGERFHQDLKVIEDGYQGSWDVKIVSCYYRSWAEERALEERFYIEDIDVDICTHIMYSFVGLGADASIRLFDPTLDTENNGFKRFTALRKKNPNLKTLVSMGGWGEVSDNYTKVVTDRILREKLVNNIVEFVTNYEFSGLDLDWEYPAQRGGIPSDKENFVLLLKALREKFDRTGLILSIAAGVGEKIAKISYDIKGISKYVNFINLMTYDFHGTLDVNKTVGHNTPMYPSSKENAEESKVNIDTVVKYWISEGAPPEKLILGTAFYGKTFTLVNPKEIKRGAPVSGPGKLEDPAYYKVCQLIINPKWQYLYDEEQKVPYIYNGNQIIAYDNVESIKKKAEYAITMNLGGVVIWSVDQDDFQGICGEKFPLLKTLDRVFNAIC
ncbi:chitinase-like protein 3 [Belonocnema kinseyi]|uniref:chitinase-like protein 3 n=1 Tax=Belonocnema kinseyi TaxID=2817044 RepID=UPI00143D55BA|nr:chitinase-like protein 3 [Belonocnema kinseyi]